jgi:excisionase family DNA binding protein
MTQNIIGQGAMSVRQTCAYLSLSRQTLYRLDIPRFKAGKKVLYLKTDLDAWLARQSRGGAA